MRKHLQSAVNTLLMILLLGVGMVLGSQGKGWGQEPVVIAEWNFDDPVKKEIVDLSANMSLEVEESTVPVFDQIGPFCQYAIVDPLPTISQNGINGTWDPSSIDTLVPGIWSYTFTPSLGQSARELNREIEIQALPDTPVIDSIVYPECGQSTFSIFFSGLPEGDWTLFPLRINGSGTTFVFHGQAPISEYFRVKYGESFSEYTTHVVINPSLLPEVDLGESITVDYGDPITLTATVSGAGPFDYLWTPENVFVLGEHNAETPTTLPLQSTTLVTLTVTDANGCISSDQLHITVDGAPLSAQPVAEPIAVCAGEPVQLFANASGGLGEYTYLWTTNTNGEEYTNEHPVVYPTTNTVYQLRVTDDLGDIVEELVSVTVHPIPEVTCPSSRTVALNAVPLELDGGTPAGGTYYLNGTPLTHFDPAQMGVGSHAIEYIYRDENECEASCSFNVEVVEELPRRLQVTFNVDMSFAQKFDPDLDKLYITGSMFNFAVPGAMPEEQRLHPTDKPELYTWTGELPIGRYYYKYFLNEGWAGEEWPSTPIRIADVSRNSNNVFHDYFGRPDNPTSVSYLSSQPINVFPNPAQYTLYITSTGEEPLRQIRIINMLGQIVYAEHIEHISSYRVDVNNIPPGLYVVQVHSFTGWHSTKVQVVN